jgi:pimeloyl-[acyl-carrier protein] synthase
VTRNISPIDRAVDEFLRYDPPEQMLGRLATGDFDLDGARIREGDVIVIVIAAANRDPAVFARPDELDVTRQGNSHLSFGFDRHTCFGAQLAKSEAQVAIRVVLERLPALRLESDCEPAWIRNAGVRGLKHLRVCW